jgi:hypothetical protein
VVKLDASGAVQWDNTIGGSGNDILFSVLQTSDGGYLLGGRSTSPAGGDKTENSLGNFDYWVVKLDGSGGVQWDHTIGGSGDDLLFSVIQTSDGGYLLGGYSDSDANGDKTENSQGGSDYWVVKLDGSGAVQWDNTIGGSDVDELYSVIQTSDGGYLLGGYSDSGANGDKTESSQGETDYWVVKLDGSGAVQWDNTIGGSGFDELKSVIQTSDGGYILGGYSESDANGDKTENSLGNFDYWVVKLDGSGGVQWDHTIGGSGNDILYSVIQTSDGGYFLGGTSQSPASGDKTENSQGGNDYWVLKLDGSGAVEWDNTIGGSGSDFLNSVIQTSDGGYLLGGFSESPLSGDKTEASLGNFDYWVVKLEGDGIIMPPPSSSDIEWDNTIGGSAFDELRSVIQTSDGGYLLGGYSDSDASGDKTENSLGAEDYWVVRLDASGAVQWDNTIGGSGSDRLASVIQTSDGGYLLAGRSQSDASGDKTENSLGNDDYWVVKLDASGAVEWDNTIGGSSFDLLRSAIQTSDGGYLLGGRSNSDAGGDKTENSLGNEDYWVVKLDASGAVEWDNTIGGSGDDELYSVIQTIDGGFFLGGYSDSPAGGDKTENSLGNEDYWVVKLDGSGAVEWDHTIGGLSSDELSSVIQTSDGGYLLGGSSQSPASGDKTENSLGGFDYWVVKLDGSGAVQWDNTIGGDTPAFLRSVVQTSDGGYFLGGYSDSDASGDKTENSQGSEDYWVVKLDGSGTVEWDSTIGGSGIDELYSVTQTSDNGYLLGGRSNSPASGDKTENSQGNYDYWVVKLEGDGIIMPPPSSSDIEWDNTIGGSAFDGLRSVIQTSDGGYLLGGRSQSPASGDKTENSQGGNDYWVVKLDASGTVQWDNTIGGSASDFLNSVIQTSDGGYLLGGFSNSPASGDKTENSQGDNDYWVVKLDASGAVEWDNTIGGSSEDELYSVIQTIDGGYLLGGRSESSASGDKTENSQGGRDYWVVKLDGSGAVQWDNTIGGSSGDNLNSVIQTSDGGYLLGGESSSPASGDKTENSLGNDDYWVVKLDGSGAVEWDHTIGGSNSDQLNSVVQTIDGGYLLGGRSNSPASGDKTENSQGSDDYWVVKLDGSGAVEWDNTIGGSGSDLLLSVVQTIDGGYFLGGESVSDASGDKTENSLGLRDYWVVKLDGSGAVEWDNTIGGSSNDELYSVTQTSDNGYLLGGRSDSPVSGDKTEASQGSFDYWVVKLEGDGIIMPPPSSSDIEWDNTIGGSSFDDLRSVIQTSDGGYLLGGYSVSDASGDKTENSQGGSDYWVVKLDGSGVVQWDHSIGGSGTDVLLSVIQTSDGGYLLGGYSSSPASGDKTENSQGSDDYWVVKLDGSGVVEWDNTIGGSNIDVLYSVIQTSDGGYLLGGTSESDASGDKMENSQGGSDYWVVKLDGSGVVQWNNTIGGSDDDLLRSVVQTSDGGYFLGGRSSSDASGDKTENSQGSNDYWVVKLDASGAVQWDHTIGSSFSDDLLSVVQTNDGGYFLGGESSSPASGDKTENSLGGNDYWVVKLDPSGAVEWDNTIGGSSFEELTSVVQTSDGGYFLGGSSNSPVSGDKTENSQGGSDYWVVKLDASGTVEWDNTIGGSGDDEFYSVLQASDGGYLLGGRSDSPVSGDKTEDSQGSLDYWVVKLEGDGIIMPPPSSSDIEWDHTIGGSAFDDLRSVVQTSDGGYLLGGYSDSDASGDKTENSLGGNDYWVVKLDASGTVQWDNTIGGSGDDELYSVIQTSDGGYLLGGFSRSDASGDKTENSLGNRDYWVVKLDGSGAVEWDNTIGGSDDDFLYSVIQTSDGGYFLGGFSRSDASGDKTENSLGNRDYWVVKLDGSGAVEWDNTIGGSVLRSV